MNIVNPLIQHRVEQDEFPTYKTTDGVYRLRKDGVYFVPETHEGHAADTERKICGYLKVECRFRDPQSNKWGKTLVWRDHDEVMHSMDMLDAQLSAVPAEVRERLADGGLYMQPRTDRTKDRLIDYLAVADPKKRARCTDRLGWLEVEGNKPVFVLPKEVIGNSAEVIRYIPPTGEDPDIRTAGTLEEWQRRIGSLAKHSSRAVLCICAALAAPLLKFANRNNSGFHLRGNSSSGKSIALMIGSSVLGSPKLKKVWRATQNAVESLALQHNDLLLHLDEIGQAPTRDLGKCIYDLMNGVQKARSNVKGYLRPVKGWRLIMLSSGEVGLRELAQENNIRVKAGQEIRLIDIPADAGRNLGVNESLPEGMTIQEYAASIKTACSECFGSPMHEWLKSLSETPPTLSEIDEGVRTIIQELNPPDSSQVKRVADAFALLAYAGEVASARHITGWPSREATKAIKRCFRAWLINFGSTESREEDEIVERAISLLIEQGGRFSEMEASIAGSKFQPANLLGWKDKDCFFVPCVAYKKEFCGGRAPREVSRILLKRGVLVPTHNSKGTLAMSQVKFINVLGKAVRVYVLRIPNEKSEDEQVEGLGPIPTPI